MTRTSFLSFTGLSLLALCMAAPLLHAQSLYTVTIDTTGVNGISGGLAFDFIAGDNLTPNNTALISGFATDATLTAASNSSTGAASGDLSGTLTLLDSGFSESFRGATFGNALYYTLNMTNNFAAPGAPDEFSFFLTDAANTSPLVTTSDPSGANALFTLDIDGTPTGALSVFTPNTPGISYTIIPAQQSVPEPSEFVFLTTGLLVCGAWLRSRRRSQ